MKSMKIWVPLVILVLLAGILLWLHPWHREESYYISDPAEAQQQASGVYRSPIAFERLQKTNADVYAFLEVPGTNISYPVLQSPTDDTYYLNHGENGNADGNGALFSEHLYNGTDFTDYLTLIYGHRMNNGDMFGKMQQTFSDPENFEDLREFIIYLPDGELHYEIFAAIPYDNRHIMYTYTVASDYLSDNIAESFLDSVYNTRALDANILDGETVTDTDHVVVLSTCQRANRQMRYLVMGRLVEESSVLPSDWPV